MASANRHLVRRWWDDQGDYFWLTEFLRMRGLLARFKFTVGLTGMVTGAASLLLLSEELNEPQVLGQGLVVGIAVFGIGWALYWWLCQWPSRRASTVLIVLCDACVIISCAVHAGSLTSLAPVPVFAVTGGYIVFFHCARLCSVHTAAATVTVCVLAVCIALSGQPDALAVAVSRAAYVWLPSVGLMPFMQFGFWLLRNSSVDSLNDTLTGVANRRGLENYLAQRQTPMVSGDPLCAFAIDVDRFKQVNDRYGHVIGDEVLARTAGQIRGCVRRSAVVARTGGEEFIVLDQLPLDAAAQVAERIRVAVQVPDDPQVTVSIGVAASWLAAHTEFAALYARADEAMYLAKCRGGNQVVLDATHRLPSQPR